MELNANSIIADACVWISYLNTEDSQHLKAKKIFYPLLKTDKNIVLTDYLIQEILTILLYKKQIELLKTFIKYIEKKDNISIISIDTNFFREIIAFAEEKIFQPKISMTDWSLLFLTNAFDFKLLSFDKQLLNATKKNK